MRKVPKGRRTEEDAHGQDSGRDGKNSQLHGQERWSQESSPPWKKIDRKGTSAARFYCFNFDSIKKPLGACTVGTNSDKRYKETKIPTATFEEPGAKAGCWEQSWVLSMPPHSTAPEGVGGHLRQPSSPGHTRTLSSYKGKPCHPPTPAGSEQVSKGNWVIFLRSSLLQQGPNKALPEMKGKNKHLLLIQLL